MDAVDGWRLFRKERLGWQERGAAPYVRVQWEFSFIPSVTGNSTERGRKTHLVNKVAQGLMPSVKFWLL